MAESLVGSGDSAQKLHGQERQGGRAAGRGYGDMVDGCVLVGRSWTILKGRQNDSHVTCNGMDEEEREADSMEFPMGFQEFFQDFHWAAKCCHVKMDETETLKFRNSPAACFQVQIS